MIIKTAKSDVNVGYSYLNMYPDQFVSEKKKLENKDYIKNSLDYFANIAYAQYWENKKTFSRNYNIMNGILDYEDFYQEYENTPEVRDFLDTLKRGTNNGLPPHVKHYPIINPPINTMLGELAKRPDIHRVRAFDSFSQNEELEYKTEIMQQLILQQAAATIQNKAAIGGQQIDEETLQQLTFEKAKDYLTDYTSLGERWANHMLSACKVEFNIKEKSESGFRDLNIVAREHFEVYEDNSKRGFNVRSLNPKHVFYKGSPDIKYMSGASGESGTPYCAGTVEVKEISTIIEEFPDLTLEEIEHLKYTMQNSLLIDGRESNLFTGAEGQNSIHYQTYNRLIWQERMMLETELGNEFRDDLPLLGNGTNAFSFGYKYVVIKVYWCSKKKVGKLTFLDEDGEPQVALVDESYQKSPNEISIEWGWVNQWYQGVKIGPDIYLIKPFTLLEYCPIIGLIYEAKNTIPKSLVDMMKPYQVLYNICMTQCYEILEKEIGVVARINVRRIPRPKNGDPNDAIDVLEDEMRRRGMLLDDDSPENTKGATQNTSIAQSIDLSRSNELQSRYQLAIALKQECWELIGMNRQRLGSPLATETATANQNALVQSFAQTEPLFTAHGYVLNQLYQAILDAAQYVESKKPLSTINYITSQGESAFVQVTGSDIKLRDLKVFVVSRAEDQQLFNEFRQLSQAMLQNGASIYDVSVLYSTNSIREMQKVFKDLKEKNDQLQAQMAQNEQLKVQQDGEIARAQLEQAERHHQDEMMMEKYKTDVKANTDLAKAQISTMFQAPGTDSDGNGQPDIVQIANHQLKLQDQIQKRDLENRRLNLEQMKFMAEQDNKKKDFEIAEEKLKNDREKIKIAKRKPAAKK